VLAVDAEGGWVPAAVFGGLCRRGMPGRRPQASAVVMACRVWCGVGRAPSRLGVLLCGGGARPPWRSLPA
jgi:hypothetical protein